MKKNILITGGSGFIGNYLIDLLHSHYDINVIGRRTDTKKVTTLYNNSCAYYSCDYSNNQINDLLIKTNPAAIVHLAAKRLDAKHKTPDSYIENLRISNNILQVCLERNIKNIINISTIGLYSSENSFPWYESSNINPFNAYALSKLLVEQTAAYYNKKGLNIKTLRLGQVIGLGEREGYALQVYLNNAIKGLPINVFGKCKGKRHYVYAKDVASAIKVSLENPNLKGIYNIGMDSIYGFDELAQTINRVFGNKSFVNYNSEAKADEDIYQMSIEKAKQELKWKPEFDLEQTYLDIKKDLNL